jgi:phospholipid/cholesterol/gamma-HCH transport system substrate-binding protein
MGDLRATSSAATARLADAEETLAAANRLAAQLETSLVRFDEAAVTLRDLATGDGAALVAELRSTAEAARSGIDAATRIAEQDLPAILADVRAATAETRRVVTEVGGDLSAASGRIDGLAATAEDTLGQATELCARAGTTLRALDGALATGERTLAAAESTFQGADRVINEEAAAIAADVRAAVRRLDGAIAQVSDDLPRISEDLRSAAASAEAAFAQLQATAAEARGPLQEFLRSALPQFAQLSRESRGLVASIERLVRQIERDPARFFFSRQTPEFRR